MMRLPVATCAEGLNAAFIGIPLDIGTSHRPGARFGPRQIRAESSLLRPYNMATGAAPFDTLQVADLGDVAINTFNLQKSVELIAAHYQPVLDSGCIPLTLGGDHTVVLPILRAVARRHGPVALIHVDAHADVNEAMFGEAIAHGTPFRRAVEEGLLQTDKVWQIGLRGSGYSMEDFDWPRQQGFTLVPAHEVWYQSLGPLMAAFVVVPGGQRSVLAFTALAFVVVLLLLTLQLVGKLRHPPLELVRVAKQAAKAFHAAKPTLARANTLSRRWPMPSRSSLPSRALSVGASPSATTSPSATPSVSLTGSATSTASGTASTSGTAKGRRLRSSR